MPPTATAAPATLIARATPEPASPDSEFLARYPSYASTAALDRLRATEYARLDRLGQIYLDYTGGGLYAESQLRDHMQFLSQHVLGNPHSHNPTSLAMTGFVDEARAAVLAFFNADPGEYEVIFTPNASGALRLVGEAYPFGPQRSYVLTADNHNSVNGIREFARARGACVSYVPVIAPELRLDDAAMRAAIAARPAEGGLLAYPAQSNFSGAQHPLAWVGEAQGRGWDVLLDAAAFVPTSRLDLGAVRPEFVTLSFYKMFGYPTGVGALIARRAALARLRRPWFAGGTILIASVQGDGRYFAEGGAAFEDGTINYLSLPAITLGLRHLAAAGMDTIHERVACLTGWMLERLLGMRHSGGQPMVRLYGPRTMEARGGTLNFNLLDPAGDALDARRIEELAGEAGISLRTGCFCNPGAGEIAHGLGVEELRPIFAAGRPLSFDELYERMHSQGKTASSIRVSVGIVSTIGDVERLLELVAGLRDQTSAQVGGPRSAGHACRETS